jgi:AcrR family transcriptional regulator
MDNTGTDPGPALPGLRERKKQKTRDAIRREAYRLFDGHGYDATSVEQIAAAAEVSASTFFRYFPTKEDVVLADDYDSLLNDAVLTQAPETPLPEAIRQAFTHSVAPIMTADTEQMRQRVRLSFAIPALRARMMDDQLASQQAIAAMISDRTGRDADELEVQCAAAAIVASFTTVMRYWVEHDGDEDLVTLGERCLTQLENSLQL